MGNKTGSKVLLL